MYDQSAENTRKIQIYLSRISQHKNGDETDHLYTN